MPPRTSTKRAPSSSRSSSFSLSSAHKTKKTRFAEDDEGFADQVEENLEGQSRRGRVRVEGYESDSSDEGGGRRGRSSGGGGGEGGGEGEGGEDGEEGEEDMFAMVEDAGGAGGGAGGGGKGKGKDAFMRLGDIEGQEFHSGKDSGEGSDSDSDADGEEGEMGYTLSSFNMREEMEEGKFTEDGMYVRTKDEHARHDAWLAGVEKADIRAARRRKREVERRKEEREEEEERVLREKGGVHALQRELLGLLRKGENCLEAMGRLGRRKRKDGGAKASADVERITHLASQIMALGDTDIYSKTYEEILRSVRSSGIVPDGWQPPSADKMFEYRWSAATGQAEVFGPFGEDELVGWFKAKYFGDAGEKIDVREVGGGWGTWDDVVS